MPWDEATLFADAARRAQRCEPTADATTTAISKNAPPRVAFCIAGAARSFAAPLVLESLRANLVTPLAGTTPESSGSSLFLSLKVADSAKSGVYGVSFGQHVSRVGPLMAALTNTWIAPLIAEAAIVNGSGAYLGPAVPTPSPLGSGLAHSRVGIVRADETLWRGYRATPCPRGNSSSSSKNNTAGGARCCRRSGYLEQGNNEERLIHQHLGLAWCAGAIRRHEAARSAAHPRHATVGRESRIGAVGDSSSMFASSLVHVAGGSSQSVSAPLWRFDVIVFSRPDLIWWAPLPAHCDFPWRTEMLSCDKPGCDMAWVAPRAHMGRLMAQARLHRDCADAGPPPHGAGRARDVRRIASCCATSEWLLWYAQSARAAPAAHAALSAHASEHGGIHVYSGSSAHRAAPSGTAIPIHRLSALEPDRGHFSLLRDTSHACTRSLSPKYATPSYALTLQQRHGLSVATGARLRLLFGEGNVSACRRAIEPWVM